MTAAHRVNKDIRRAHLALKPRLLPFILHGRPLMFLIAPLIYSVALPLLCLDLWLTAYQWLCFPVFGIPKVRRRDYFVIDHQRLAYLNAIEKLNCVYCSYANGTAAYVREVAARTEQYWCPIKHASAIPNPHNRYHHFVDFGDAQGYRRELEHLRRAFAGPKADQRAGTAPPVTVAPCPPRRRRQ